jgi:hypothetical protein
MGIRFRRTFNQLASEEWRQLLLILENTTLCQGQDNITWGLDPSRVYTVSSMYNKLSQGASVAHFKEIWATKLPLKIKIFSRQLALGHLPSSDLITYRHGPASGRCALCNHVENINHIFFLVLSSSLHAEYVPIAVRVQLVSVLVCPILCDPIKFCWDTPPSSLAFVCGPKLDTLTNTQ